MTMFKNVMLICLGRFLIGAVACTANMIMGKSISETMPEKLTSQYGAFTNITINFGFLLSFFLGILLPSDPSESSEMWKLISSMPAITGFLSVFLMEVFFKEEPVAFCLANNREQEAKSMLARVYKSDVSPGEPAFNEAIEGEMFFRRSTTSMESSKASFCSAVFGPRFRRASIVCFIINVFNQYTGISPVIMFCGSLLKTLNKTEPDFPVSPLLGAIVIGFTSFLANVLAFFIIQKMGRKTLLTLGQLGCAFFLGITGLLLLKEEGLLAFITICIFVAIYQIT